MCVRVCVFFELCVFCVFCVLCVLCVLCVFGCSLDLCLLDCVFACVCLYGGGGQDSEECLRLRPDWVKGYTRKLAALEILRR